MRLGYMAGSIREKQAVVIYISCTRINVEELYEYQIFHLCFVRCHTICVLKGIHSRIGYLNYLRPLPVAGNEGSAEESSSSILLPSKIVVPTYKCRD